MKIFAFLIGISFFVMPASADPFQVSMETWNHQYILYLRSGSPLEKSEILKKVKSPLLHEELEVALDLRDRSKPVVLVIPGLFGGYNTIECRRVSQWLGEKGLNVLRVPDPVSVHVVGRHPTYPGLDFESEAQLYVDIVHAIQNEYHFPKVYLAGVSYGAFISAVTAVKLGPDFGGKLLMMSPPHNMLTSLKIIDGFFDEVQDQFDEFPWQPLWFLIKVEWSRFWRTDIHISPELAKNTMIVGGFHRTFLELWDMQENYLHPRPWWKFYEKWAPALKKKQNEMRFATFLRQVNPHFFETPEKDSVLYWLNQVPGDWKLITSNDDFINPPGGWPSSPRIVSIPNSGHIFGYFDNPEFLKIITEFYN